MKPINQLSLAVLGVVILGMLYGVTTKSLPWPLMPFAASAPSLDPYAKSQYLKYAGRDPVGEKITAQSLEAWQQETWSSDDKPYQQIRQEVEASFTSGKPAVQLAEEYRKEAQNNPKSPLAQFHWAYAIWKTLTPTSSSAEKQTNGIGAFFTLAYTLSPDTYNYARLRYLLSYQYQNGDQTVLGERLLQRDTQDAEVKAHLALDYTGKPYSLASKTRAIQLSREMIQANPKCSRCYAIRAEAYYTAYYENGRHRKDGLAVIAALKEYLSLAKPNEYFYQPAKDRLADMDEKVNPQ